MSHSTDPVGHDVSSRQRRRAERKGFKVVSARLRSPEYESFSRQARSVGLTDSMAIRVAVRRIGGFLEIDAETRRGMEGILQEIGVLSSNVAALLAAYCEDPVANVEAVRIERIAFGEAFADLDSLLRSILSVSRRRTDGCSMLKNAVEQ
ncbi:T-DNA border endonuclease subunit VirD1 (plasmid) [Bradyrhizobium sp. CCGUVB23]|nr:T-DNA border endonuclease subunit VirD1 [Bradyrhizobium sp. CCGUVB23]MCP3468654.1 T-DNA border endonuclease subunit VirD1 [Bradyrhizobium sp. CCGUVB23]